MYKLKRLESAFETLKKSLPNSRKDLFHLHYSILMKETQSRAFDPDRLTRKIQAPLILSCSRKPNGPLYCERCREKLTDDEALPCKKAPSSSPNMRCTPCAPCVHCKRRLPLDYYENTDAWTFKSKDLIKTMEIVYGGGVFPSGALDMGALLFSVAHGGGLAWQSLVSRCNLNRTKYVCRVMSRDTTHFLGRARVVTDCA